MYEGKYMQKREFNLINLDKLEKKNLSLLL